MIRTEDLIKKLKELKEQADYEICGNEEDELIVNFNNGVLWCIRQIEMELSEDVENKG